MTESRERKRVLKQSEAAAFLGISKTRLQQFQQEAGPSWWREEFRNASGYDVVGIARAQTEADCVRRLGDSPKTQAEQRVAEAENKAAMAAAEIKILEQRKRQRLEMEAERSLVSAEIVVSLFSESLADLRSRMDDLPYRFAQQVPDEFKSFVFREESEGEPALFQEFMRELVQSYEDFWEVLASEVFDDPEDEGAEF